MTPDDEERRLVATIQLEARAIRYWIFARGPNCNAVRVLSAAKSRYSAELIILRTRRADAVKSFATNVLGIEKP